jgi:hypothetical protein
MTRWPASPPVRVKPSAETWAALFDADRWRHAALELVDAGVSPLAVLRARRWHRLDDPDCPCPAHGGDGGFDVEFVGDARRREASQWRRRMVGGS